MNCCHMHTVKKTKPHRAVGSPALCGLKLLCEFSQARAGKGNKNRLRRRKKRRKTTSLRF